MSTEVDHGRIGRKGGMHEIHELWVHFMHPNRGLCPKVQQEGMVLVRCAGIYLASSLAASPMAARGDDRLGKTSTIIFMK